MNNWISFLNFTLYDKPIEASTVVSVNDELLDQFLYFTLYDKPKETSTVVLFNDELLDQFLNFTLYVKPIENLNCIVQRWIIGSVFEFHSIW